MKEALKTPLSKLFDSNVFQLADLDSHFLISRSPRSSGPNFFSKFHSSFAAYQEPAARALFLIPRLRFSPSERTENMEGKVFPHPDLQICHNSNLSLSFSTSWQARNLLGRGKKNETRELFVSKMGPLMRDLDHLIQPFFPRVNLGKTGMSVMSSCKRKKTFIKGRKKF